MHSRQICSFHIAQRWGGSNGGGLDRVVQELAAHLPEAGIGFAGFVTGPAALALESGGRFHAFAPEQAGTLARLRGARTVIGAAIRNQRPDLVASHFALYAWPILDRLHSTPHVVHFHGPWAAESLQDGGSRLAAYPKHALEAQVYRSARRVIVLSQAFRDLIVQEYGVPPERVSIVPGSVNIARFAVKESRSQARALLGWPLHRPILLTVRRLVGRMGLDRLIDAVDLVRRQVPDVLLLICGTGRLHVALGRQVEQLGLSRHVRFPGFIQDEQLPLVYRAASLNVVPTTALEGFGLVAAEALAAGTPSVVTPVGGLPEVVSALSPNLVFPSGAPSDMARHLIELLQNTVTVPDENGCRSYAASRFNSALMAERTAQVYRQALAAG